MAKAQHSRWCRAIWIIFGLAVVVGVSSAVRPIGSRASPSASNAVAPAAMPVIIDAIGTVQSIDSVCVQPRVTGTIEKIEFASGQYVNKGPQLFEGYQTASSAELRPSIDLSPTMSHEIEVAKLQQELGFYCRSQFGPEKVCSVTQHRLANGDE